MIFKQEVCFDIEGPLERFFHTIPFCKNPILFSDFNYSFKKEAKWDRIYSSEIFESSFLDFDYMAALIKLE